MKYTRVTDSTGRQWAAYTEREPHRAGDLKPVTLWLVDCEHGQARPKYYTDDETADATGLEWIDQRQSRAVFPYGNNNAPYFN